MKVYEHPEVRLLSYHGSDELVAISAWSSTNSDVLPNPFPVNDFKALASIYGEGKRNDVKSLINFLAEHKHLTPFEFCNVTFQVTVDIATHIHLLKHRTIKCNTESARYKELADKIYIPSDMDESFREELLSQSNVGHDSYHGMLEYDKLVGSSSRQRSKESSRYFLGYNKMLTSIVQFDMRNFLWNFFYQRSSKNAQKEIRTVAHEMFFELVKTGAFPETLQAFSKFNPQLFND